MPTETLKDVLKPHVEQLAGAFMFGTAEGRAALWREIIAAHPQVEILRKIAFEMSVAEAKQTIFQHYPLLEFVPDLDNKISSFQIEMRRTR